MGILQRSESRDGARVIWLAVHSSEGNDTPADDARALRDASWWTGSSHAIADDEPGTLLTPADGCVPYELAAWTIRGGNHYSDNIELVGRAAWTRAQWLAQPRLLDLCARWLADRHKARPWIPLRRLSLAEIRAKVPGVIGHVDYTNATGDGTHWDPGPGFPWDVVLGKANIYAAGGSVVTTPDLEDDMAPWILRNFNGGAAYLIVGEGIAVPFDADANMKEARDTEKLLQLDFGTGMFNKVLGEIQARGRAQASIAANLAKLAAAIPAP